MNENTRDAKDRLVQDVGAVIADAEQLLRSAANDGSERARSLQADLQVRLQGLREQVRQIEATAAARARAAAQATDTYVHDKPWQAVAMAAGIGAIVGLVAAMVFAGRDG